MRRSATVNVLTGNIESGDLSAMEDQTAVVVGGVVVIYSFYDAPAFKTAGLPDVDQCYVTVTPDYSNWMAITAPMGSALAHKSFGRMVLPSAHDVGMNNMQNAETCINGAPKLFLSVLKSFFGVVQEAASKIDEHFLTGV